MLSTQLPQGQGRHGLWPQAPKPSQAKPSSDLLDFPSQHLQAVTSSPPWIMLTDPEISGKTRAPDP